MIYNPTDILDFGKNKGHSLEIIWKYEPTYIAWLIMNIDTFAINEEKFLLLPVPTPISTGAVSNTMEYKQIMQSNNSLLQKLTKIDSNNRLCVDDIIKLEQLEGKLTPIPFWFSKEVLDLNTRKKRLINNL